MAGENNRSVEGLGAGKMNLVGDFRLLDENGDELFKVDSETGDVTAAGSLGGTGTAAGLDTQVQFNSSNNLGASADLTFDDSTNTLTVGSPSNGTIAVGSLDMSSNGLITLGSATVPGGLLLADSSKRINQDAGELFYDMTNNFLAVGHNNPSATLDLVGTMQFVDGNEGANKVLTSDASGNASWQTPSAGSPAGSNTFVQFNNSGAFGGTAGLTYDDSTTTLYVGDGSYGNIVTNKVDVSGGSLILQGGNQGGLVFIGATDNAQADATQLFWDLTNSRLGVGTGAPAYLLDVNGVANASAYFVGGTPGISAGPFTTITSITVVNGIVTDLQGS